MKIRQETVIADTDNRQCIHCKTEFTTEELIEDPGVWHATSNFEIECDACVDARQEYQRDLAERQYEMRAAFGEGEIVVNILTGEEYIT